MLDVRAVVVFGEPVVDAVHPAAVSAGIGDEFFGPADCAVFHARLVIGLFAHLKSCLQERASRRYDGACLLVTHGLESFRA